MIEKIKEFGDFECPEKVELLLDYLEEEPTQEIIESIEESGLEYILDGETYIIWSLDEAWEYEGDWNNEIFDINIEEVPEHFRTYIDKVVYLDENWISFEDIMENCISYNDYYIINE